MNWQQFKKRCWCERRAPLTGNVWFNLLLNSPKPPKNMWKMRFCRIVETKRTNSPDRFMITKQFKSGIINVPLVLFILPIFHFMHKFQNSSLSYVSTTLFFISWEQKRKNQHNFYFFLFKWKIFEYFSLIYSHSSATIKLQFHQKIVDSKKFSQTLFCIGIGIGCARI